MAIINYRALFAIFLFVINTLESVRATQCLTKHPQMYYCDSDFILLGRILDKKEFNGTGLKYLVETAFYKPKDPKEDARLVNKERDESGQFNMTLYSRSECLLDLNINENYVISGRLDGVGKPTTECCGYVKRWSELTDTQMFGLLGAYGNNDACQCKIPEHGYFAKPYDPKFCTWMKTVIPFDCEYSDAMCSQSISGSCSWTSVDSDSYVSCREKHFAWASTQFKLLQKKSNQLHSVTKAFAALRWFEK